MSTNYTANYQLCQWEAGDQVLRTEFNQDNQKIDAAIKGVDQKLDTSIQTVQQQITSLSSSTASQFSQLSGAMARLGNCKLYTGSYVGTGTSSHTVTFPGPPYFVYIGDSTREMCISFLRGMPEASMFAAAGAWISHLTWDGNSVRLEGSGNAEQHLNEQARTYPVMALIDLNEEG